MIDMEDIFRAASERIRGVTAANGYPFTVADVRVNPSSAMTQYPCVNLFDDDDTVTKREARGSAITCTRQTHLDMEFWIQPSTERRAVYEILLLYKCLRWVLLGADRNLGLHGVEIAEELASGTTRSAKGEALIGRAVRFIVRYSDTVSDPRS